MSVQNDSGGNRSYPAEKELRGSMKISDYEDMHTFLRDFKNHCSTFRHCLESFVEEGRDGRSFGALICGTVGNNCFHDNDSSAFRKLEEAIITVTTDLASCAAEGEDERRMMLAKTLGQHILARKRQAAAYWFWCREFLFRILEQIIKTDVSISAQVQTEMQKVKPDGLPQLASIVGYRHMDIGNMTRLLDEGDGHLINFGYMLEHGDNSGLGAMRGQRVNMIAFYGELLPQHMVAMAAEEAHAMEGAPDLPPYQWSEGQLCELRRTFGNRYSFLAHMLSVLKTQTTFAQLKRDPFMILNIIKKNKTSDTISRMGAALTAFRSLGLRDHTLAGVRKFFVELDQMEATVSPLLPTLATDDVKITLIYSTMISVAGLETCLRAIRTKYEAYKVNGEFVDPVGPSDMRDAVLEQMARMHEDQLSLKTKKGGKIKGSTDPDDILPAANKVNQVQQLLNRINNLEKKLQTKSGSGAGAGAGDRTNSKSGRPRCQTCGLYVSSHGDPPIQCPFPAGSHPCYNCKQLGHDRPNCTNDHRKLISQADSGASASSESGGRDNRGSASAGGRGSNRDQRGRSGGQRSNHVDGAAANNSRGAASAYGFDDEEFVDEDDSDNVSAGSDADHINSTSWISAVRRTSARTTGGNEAPMASAPAPPVGRQDE